MEPQPAADRPSRPAPQTRQATWPRGIPALRLGRLRPPTAHPSPQSAATEPTEPPAVPPHLRARRLGTGAVLLLLAWAGIVATVLLASTLWADLPRQHLLSPALALVVLGAVATCWLAITTAGCLFAGAFSLTLALTRRDW